MSCASASLTFDDGPDPEWTPRVLTELVRSGVHATFFVIGERVRRTPDLVRAAAAGGHDIELHCHRHIRHSELSEAELEADTRTALGTLAEIGIKPTRWRAPWGVCTEATRAVAELHSLELGGWSLDTQDWRGDSSAVMFERASRTLERGSVVLMHDGLGPGAQREGCLQTVELIAPLSALARDRGLELAPLSKASSLSSTAGSSFRVGESESEIRVESESDTRVSAVQLSPA
jgi:peptidoglycan/xylan/chitin deacetylase (PgdA/CDA1 family)